MSETDDRPCRCGRVTECPNCWLAANSEPHRAKWGITGPVPPPPPPDRSQWPLHARLFYRLRREGERGVGDTVARLLGAAGEKFKVVYKKITGNDCGCADRQASLNTLYPY